MINKIYILAGNYSEYRQFIRELDVDDEHFVFVHREQQLRGIDPKQNLFILYGNWLTDNDQTLVDLFLILKNKSQCR